MSNIRKQVPQHAEPMIAPNPEDLGAKDPAAHINKLQGGNGGQGGPGGVLGYGPKLDYNHEGQIINSQNPDNAPVVAGLNADTAGTEVVPDVTEMDPKDAGDDEGLEEKIENAEKASEAAKKSMKDEEKEEKKSMKDEEKKTKKEQKEEEKDSKDSHKKSK